MHNVWSRANAVFAYATTTLFVVTALIAFSSIWERFSPLDLDRSTALEITRLQAQDGYDVASSLAFVPFSLNTSRSSLSRASNQLHYMWNTYYYTPTHYAALEFNLTADLRPLFQWNTKQLYVFVTLQYDPTLRETHTEDKGEFQDNKLVIWDAIVTDREDARLILTRESNRYAIVDVKYRQAHRLAHVPAQLKLEWCTHTLLGATRCSGIRDDQVATFTFPALDVSINF